jgi:hypothetical protein
MNRLVLAPLKVTVSASDDGVTATGHDVLESSCNMGFVRRLGWREHICIWVLLAAPFSLVLVFDRIIVVVVVLGVRMGILEDR